MQNVVTYDVVIGVDNSDLALKPGMTASTRIIVEQRSDVLRVPDQALRYTPGGLAGAGPARAATRQARVWVLRDGRADRGCRSTLGLDDDNFTEIVNGDFKPGDQVIIAESRGQADSPSGLPPPRL